MAEKSSTFGKYFVLSSVVAHLFLLVLFFLYPQIIGKVYYFAVSKYYDRQVQQEVNNFASGIKLDVDEDIRQSLKPWKPLPQNVPSYKRQKVAVNGVLYATTAEALEHLNHGDTLAFYEGTYKQGFSITKNDITLVGVGHVIFEKGAYKNKGFIVSQGNNLTIKNIECRHISVVDENGACIRHEGSGLSIEHVYFHRSENGILETHGKVNEIRIKNSRFERLGKSGLAHGIYSNNANLYIDGSLIIASKDQGHGIKNRGLVTRISNSVIASYSSDDSRLVDIPNGGALSIENSILAQGPLSVNGQAIGFGLEGISHSLNSIEIKNNIILLERIKQNQLLSKANATVDMVINSNTIVWKNAYGLNSDNQIFSSREEAGIKHYPMLPVEFCISVENCSLLAN